MDNENSIMNRAIRSELSADDFKTGYTLLTSGILVYNTFVNMTSPHPADYDFTLFMYLVSNFFVQRNNRYNPEFGVELKNWINTYSWVSWISIILVFFDMYAHISNPVMQFAISIIFGIMVTVFTLYTRGKVLSFDEVEATLNRLVDELHESFPEIMEQIIDDVEKHGGLGNNYGKKMVSVLKSEAKTKVPTDHAKKEKNDSLLKRMGITKRRGRRK